jgi:hypothetical protein
VGVDGEDLPGRPEPEINTPDESNWLFDSNRTYLAQLAVYRERRGDGEAEEESNGEADA